MKILKINKIFKTKNQTRFNIHYNNKYSNIYKSANISNNKYVYNCNVHGPFNRPSLIKEPTTILKIISLFALISLTIYSINISNIKSLDTFGQDAKNPIVYPIDSKPFGKT